MVGRPSWRAGMGREALQEGEKWLGGFPEGPGGVRRIFLRTGRGREDLSEGGRGQEALRRAGRFREALSESREPLREGR